MQTDPEMNEKIVAILQQHDNPAVLYAAMRIEELERQLAVMWGSDEPHESGDECLSCERLAMQEAWPYCRVCLLTAQLEVCDDGFGEARAHVMERTERLGQQLRELQALLGTERQAAMERIEELETGLAYCNAECETAMKYAIAAEQQLEVERQAARDVIVAYAELEEALSGETTDNLALINLRRAVTQ